MAKKKPQKQIPYIQFTYFVIVVLIIFIAFTVALLILNNKVSNLETNALYSNINPRPNSSVSSSEPNSLTPVCQQNFTGVSSSGGLGDTITSLSGDNVTIANLSGTFHLCDNLKVYDVVTGKPLEKSALKVGENIWVKSNAGNYIREIQIVSYPASSSTQ